MKKLLALLTALVMVFTLASCKGSEEEPETSSRPVAENGGEVAQEQTDYNTQTQQALPGEDITEEVSQVQARPLPDDPEQWTDEEIVEFYKQAAIKSKTAVKSKQQMTMTEMVVNNGTGILGTLVEMATPIMKSALKKNSTEFDGITGGYENLTISDTTSVKAYKSGGYIVVEMALKEQTDGAHGDTFTGTVGHAISVVGDVSAVAEALPQFNIDFDHAQLKLHYSNPKFKAKINQNGIVEKGTWTYTVDVTVKNLHVAAVRLPLAATIDSAYGTVDYLITTGGGF